MSQRVFEGEKLKRWFYAARRELPWREISSPYEVWVSEIMLQQTQVTVVIPYYKRWMERFPTITALAEAELDEVIKLWEGLGYYSRARNLHEGARMVLKEYGGELPQDAKELGRIKGIGPYTVGAILSFAFKQKAAAVDGNVLRVMARVMAIHEPIDQTHTKKRIETITHSILPDKEPWIMMEALIELGALVCQKKPNCDACPLNKSCLAKAQGVAEALPKKGKRIPTTTLHRFVALLQGERGILIKKGEKGKVMADLWEFPYFENDLPVSKALPWKNRLEKTYALKLSYLEALPKVDHGFTRYKALLYPFLWQTRNCPEIEGHEWVPLNELSKKAFSSGHRKIAKLLK